MRTSIKTELTHYAAIGAAAIPVARVAGETTALIFCLIAAVLSGLARKKH